MKNITPPESLSPSRTPRLSATESTLMTWRNPQGRKEGRKEGRNMNWYDWYDLVCLLSIARDIRWRNLTNTLNELEIRLQDQIPNKNKNKKNKSPTGPRHVPTSAEATLSRSLLAVVEAFRCKAFRCPKLSVYKSPQKLKSSQNLNHKDFP